MSTIHSFFSFPVFLFAFWGFSSLLSFTNAHADLAGFSFSAGGLQPRQGLTCSPTQPCADGSCCDGQTFFCGIDADHCAAGTCISNCNATAECGQYADPPGKTCPLNVCCGQWGFCGVTEAFCGSGCQSHCDQPPATNLNSGNVTALVIGYIEAWNLQLNPNVGCAYRSFDWIPIDSISHLNVAFGYIQPSTFTIAPMPGVHIETFQNLTAIKQRAPGLQIWLSLGGWTYSDNGTDTQPVWGDVARTADSRTQFVGNLASFLTEWGFDGVDLDWEYPGAPDRGGRDEDTANYVLLLQAIRDAFDDRVAPTTWGLSFTAPTSYWYLRWFDVGNMTQIADWMNLMSYDLHGSWDSPTDQIGSNVYAHTNMTEITSALDLLWRNDVPANKVNLGIGFYGRSYTLSDPTCRTPGCPFSAAGSAGPCTQTDGILSYQELMSIRNTKNVPTTTDQDAQVVYFTYDNDQWVSYDDATTLAAKTKYANDNGLLGLFIWAIDQDDQYHTALAALVGQLGKFAAQNGVGSYSTWSGASSSCYLGDCAATPVCSKHGTAQLGDSINCGRGMRRNLCCPLGNMPDPQYCQWVDGGSFVLKGDDCNAAKCSDSQVQIAESKDYIIDGGDSHCLDSGTAKYCCDASESGKNLCGPVTGKCFHKADIMANMAGICPEDRKTVTFSEGSCDTANDLWQAWCCAENAETAGCYWTPGRDVIDSTKCDNLESCRNNEVDIGSDFLGGGKIDCTPMGTPVCPQSPIPTCSYPGQQTVPRHLCCPAGDLNIKITEIPVPLANLFPSNPPETNQNDWQIDVDHLDSPLDNADINGFGWHIISGPADATTSMDKRDGSHWELLGCDNEAHQQRRTVKAVCTDESAASNCNEIFKGGVATTVVKMPRGCGPGKYAVAVSLEAAADPGDLPHGYKKRLVKRFNMTQPRVYDFTFDYDYTPVTKRADASEMLLRIDYSDDPGYWGTVVSLASDVTIGKREDLELVKRELQAEVDRDHGGSWHRYMDHRFSVERRATPDDQLHELHARWFSADLANWLRALRYVDHKYEALRHSINQQYIWYIFDYVNKCDFMGIPQDSYLRAWTELDINVEVSGELSLIGDLGHLESFAQSSVLFRTLGDITASINIEAFAQLTFSSNRIELFGLDTFGATFAVPGLVTVGPNLQVFGQLDGQATLHAEATVAIDLAHWDYTQQYPNQDQADQGAPTQDQGVIDNARTDVPQGSGEAGSAPLFHADVDADGYLKVTISPVLTFGITWALDAIPDTSIEFGMDTYGTVAGTASGVANNTFAGAQACYGMTAGYQVYASVNAPAVFNYPLSQSWVLTGPNEIDIVPQTCYDFTIWDGTNPCVDCPVYPDATDTDAP